MDDDGAVSADRTTADRDPGRNFTLRYLGPVGVPPFGKVTSVAVIPWSPVDGTVVVVELRDRGVDIPGGHTRRDETGPEQTARREALEEACIELEGDLRVVEVIESDFYGQDEEDLTYMVIYTARVGAELPFVENDESVTRLHLHPEDFVDRYAAGDAEAMRRAVSRSAQIMGIS